jgi:hypothetical protein
MFNGKHLAAMSLGLIAAACSGPYDRQAPVPSNVSRAATPSERTCLDYGFAGGSAAYDRCVQREARSREAGRVNRDYAEARLLDDSRNACYDYGLDRGTQRYDNCVAREVDARRYRDQGQISVPPQAYVPDYAPAPSPAPYVAPRPATTGVAVSRDEFGFRDDAQGNRVDRNGRIISPQSTTP